MGLRRITGRALLPGQLAPESPGAVFPRGLEAIDPDMFSEWTEITCRASCETEAGCDPDHLLMAYVK